jgi:hypothetical protein
MRPITIDIDPADVDADGLAAANSSAGTTVTLDGALASGGTFTSADGLGRKLAIQDAGAHNQTTATYTVTGTGISDSALTEPLAGPGISATVETTAYFKTVTSITIANPVAGSTVNIGTVDEVEAPTIPVNWRSGYAPYMSVGITGTLNYTVRETNVAIQTQTPVWFNITSLASKTANAQGSATVGTTAVSLIFNSYTNGAEAQIYLTQPDN